MRSSTDKLKSTTNICIQYKRSSRQFKKGVPARENGQYCSNFRQFLRNFYKFSKKKKMVSTPGTPLDPPMKYTCPHFIKKKTKKTDKYIYIVHIMFTEQRGSLPFNFTRSTFFLPIQFTLLKS